MGLHVLLQIAFISKRFTTLLALVRPLPCMGQEVLFMVIFSHKAFATVRAAVLHGSMLNGLLMPVYPVSLFSIAPLLTQVSWLDFDEQVILQFNDC